MLLLITSFIAGVLTVLAPCILPFLPVIIGGSLSGDHLNKKKAATVIISLGVSVILFTFLLKVSSLLIVVPEYTWKLISGSIVLGLGLVTLFPALWENKLLFKLSAKSNEALGVANQKKSLLGDIIVGACLGPVFSTCSPTYFVVLATVLPVNPLLGIVYLLAYTLGLCLMLLLVATLGKNIITKLGVASNPHGAFKKSLGVIFIIVGLAILTSFDKKIETQIINSGFFDVTKLEQKILATKDSLVAAQQNLNTDKRSDYKKAPELSSISGYINTNGKAITLEELRGKVVLLDVWTYSCINCQRTLPYVNDWYAKYKDQGLEIIGLHTPEFGFEKLQANVEKAVKGFGIKYPVVLDNDYATWQELGNQYWPRKYLIDTDGYIIYDHIGEGNYAETEKAIQKALKDRAAKLNEQANIPEDISQPASAVDFQSGRVNSPEVYFGSDRNEYLANGTQNTAGKQSFTLPQSLKSNKLYLAGDWNLTAEYAENSGPAEISFNYQAKNVYFTAGAAKGASIEVYQDEVLVKKITITDQKLYQLIAGTDYSAHRLHIKVLQQGLQAFTFTFG